MAEGAVMKKITSEEASNLIKNRDVAKVLDLSESDISDVDMSGWDLRNIDFSGSNFENVDLTGADFDRAVLYKVWFKDCPMKNVRLTNADVTEATMRYIDLSGSDFSGSDFHHALFEYAVLDDITDDEDTKFYRLRCPGKGAFIAWKCCTELRVVQLLVPADARRVSATAETCRCDKAKVLSIKSIDESVSYDWAQSTVDPDFYYEKGKWVYPSAFQPDRWMDSSPGIHFFMDRQESVDYQAK